MRSRWSAAAAIAAALLAGVAGAQVPAILFSGSRPFVGLDAANERPGGAINRITEFDFTFVLPVAGSSRARSLLPATAMHCYLGDGDLDGDWLKLRTWKASPATPLGIGGLFVRAADRDEVSWDKVYFTVRYGPGVLNEQLEVLIGGGIPYLIEPADWVRLLPNGDAQWFLAPGQLRTAAGPQVGTGTVGTSALLQDDDGSLYYSPSEGGHWVHGNTTGPLFCDDGSICKIDHTFVTYDGNGNVAGIVPGSTRLLAGEITVRSWVQQAGAFDRTGGPLQAADYGKTTGLAFDPAGGTWTPSHPDAQGNLPAEPHLIFCSEAAAYAGTLFSTRNGGEVAIVAGIPCGSTAAGQPADGSWLGVAFDPAADQPSLLGMTLVEVPPVPMPLLTDQNDFGYLPTAANQPDWQLDLHGEAGVPAFVLLAAGPQPPARFPPSLALGSLPLPATANSWPDVFVASAPITLGIAVTDANGYATVSRPNPNHGSIPGFAAVAQAIALHPAGLQIGSPVLVQLQ